MELIYGLALGSITLSFESVQRFLKVSTIYGNQNGSDFGMQLTVILFHITVQLIYPKATLSCKWSKRTSCPGNNLKRTATCFTPLVCQLTVQFTSTGHASLSSVVTRRSIWPRLGLNLMSSNAQCFVVGHFLISYFWFSVSSLAPWENNARGTIIVLRQEV